MNNITIIMICSFVNLLLSICVLIKSSKSQNNKSYEKTPYPELSPYELERLEREESFDNRINQMKEELANQQTIIKHGTTADELHPLVHNLPHNIIPNKYDTLPDVEVAE